MKERCGYCKKGVVFLIECSLCHNKYCLKDRHPESHMCVSVDQYKKEKIVLEKVVSPKIDAL